jgi:glycosyltransferase involved in cell wall biosynthesis
MSSVGLKTAEAFIPSVEPATSGEVPIEVSIIMPCLNEAETIEKCIKKALEFLRNNGISGEVIVGDNGSTDGSQSIAQRCGARVVDVSERGYGSALYHASMAARGNFIIMGDSDDSYDFTRLSPFVSKLREGFDLAMGNRFKGGIEPGAMPWKNRYIGNPALSAVGRLFFRCPVADFHCGLRAYSRDAFRELDLRTTGMEFASEMVVKATLKQMRIAEVPTTLSRDGRSRKPHLRPWRDGWRHMRFMLLYSPRWLFFYPGFILMVIGFLLGGRLLWGPLYIDRIGLDVHTLLYCSMLVWVGLQAMLFAMFTNVFATSENLLPPDPLFSKLADHFTLEHGLGTGILLVLVGFVLSCRAVLHWQTAHFGSLLPSEVLREVIPAVLAVSLGIQIVFASFFMSVLGLGRRTLGGVSCRVQPLRLTEGTKQSM